MKGNMGWVDRVIRIVIGVAVLSLVFVAEGGMRWLGLIGIIPLASALAGYCPLYALLGLNTCRLNPRLQ